MSEQYGNYGVTNTGFNPKPIDVLEDDAKAYLKQLFGENVDLTQQSPLWRMIQVPLVEISQLWLTAEQNFYSDYIQTAEGVALDLLGEDLGLNRKPAVSSVVQLTIYKNTSDPVIVPEGSLFQTVDGIIFATNEEISIGSGDPATTTGTVWATAVESGVNSNVSAGTIITATNIISGVDHSNNTDPAEGGEDVETDGAYRKRLMSYVRATWTAAAIRSAAVNVDGVAGVKIIENSYSYDCLIVPQTLFTAELQAAVEEAIEKVTPVTVEYTVIEAESVLIDVNAIVVLDSLLDLSTAQSMAAEYISEYIAALNIDDDVIKAKVIQAIMQVSGILNAYSMVLAGRPINEKHTYNTGTLSYALNYTTGTSVDSVIGKLSSVDHTFVAGVDYNFVSTPARIVWTGSGSLPDNGTDFKTSYNYPANVIGDVVINQENVAKIGSITFTNPP